MSPSFHRPSAQEKAMAQKGKTISFWQRLSLLRYWKAMHLSVSEIILRIIAFVLFLGVALSYLYLIFWCFYSGMRNMDDFALNPFGFSKIQISNYIEVFSQIESNGTSFWGMIGNSLFFSFLGPLLCIFVTCQFAYAAAKYRFPGNKLLYVLVLGVTILPLYGTGNGMYKLLYNLGWMNTYWMILTSLGGFNIYFLFFYAFFQSLSWTYAEAAQVDGANPWQIFFRVMLPQALPMFGSLFLMCWITEWNSYASALIYLPQLPTLAVGIYNFRTLAVYTGRMDLLYAACAISMLPPLLLFAFCNKTLMSNVSIGGIKE